MWIHLQLTIDHDSDITITEDKPVHYFRVDVGSILMGWANNDLDSFSIRQYNGTGRLLISPVGLFFHKRANKRDWPMFKFSPSDGSGTCSWCIEPFIACLLVPQRCFVSRPLTSGMRDGYAHGGLCNFSIDLGSVNTYIIHRPTGFVFLLCHSRSRLATAHPPPLR